ncbi:MAG TPA: hypothetical protein VIM55_08530 [Mucilaginibacter sp.]
MKAIKIFTLAALVVLAIAGCKKDLNPTTIRTSKNVTSELISKWELRIQRGGMVPDVNFAPGNGNIKQFNADGTYKFYENGAVTAQGTFEIKMSSNSDNESLKYIYYDHATTGEIFDIRDNTLTLGTSAADGPSYVYAKE